MHQLILYRKTQNTDIARIVLFSSNRIREVRGQAKHQFNSFLDMMAHHDYFGFHDYTLFEDEKIIMLFDVDYNLILSHEYVIEEGT